MAQITWRNINNPSFTGGNEAIESGNQNLLAGINQLAGVGGKLESNQRNEQTAEQLAQIQGLDRSGLATALANNTFANPQGNVDKDAIRKALAGQGKVIDTREDYKFGRDELAADRSDADTISRIEAANARGDFGESMSLAESLSNKNTGKYIGVVKQAERGARKIDDEDKARKRDMINREQRETGETSIPASVAQVDTLMGEGIPLESLRNLFRDQISSEEISGERRTVSEVAELMSLFDNEIADRNKLSPDSEEELSLINADSDDSIQAEFNKVERDFQLLEAATPTDKPLSPAENKKALVALMDKADSLIPDGSWLASGEVGGRELKRYLEGQSNAGVPTDVLELALVTNAQTEEESYGNPAIWAESMDKTIKSLLTDTGRKDALDAIAVKRNELAGLRDNLDKTKRGARYRNKQDLIKRKNTISIKGSFGLN